MNVIIAATAVVCFSCMFLLIAAHDVISRLLLNVPGGSALLPDDANYRHPKDTK